MMGCADHPLFEAPNVLPQMSWWVDLVGLGADPPNFVVIICNSISPKVGWNRLMSHLIVSIRFPYKVKWLA